MTEVLSLTDRVRALKDEINFMYLWPPAHPSIIARREKELKQLEEQLQKEQSEKEETEKILKDEIRKQAQNRTNSATFHGLHAQCKGNAPFWVIIGFRQSPD